GELVADRLRLADREAGRLVEVVQQRHLVAGEDTSDRRAGNTEVIADPRRPPTAGEPQRHDAPLEPPRRTRRLPMWSGAAVGQRQTGPITGRPTRRSRRRALEPLRRAAHRPALINDEASKASPALRSEWRVSVSHEDLRGNDL